MSALRGVAGRVGSERDFGALVVAVSYRERPTVALCALAVVLPCCCLASVWQACGKLVGKLVSKLLGKLLGGC